MIITCYLSNSKKKHVKCHLVEAYVHHIRNCQLLLLETISEQFGSRVLCRLEIQETQLLH